MKRTSPSVTRLHLSTRTAYADVLDAIRSSIGRPTLARISRELRRPQSGENLKHLLRDTLNSTELIEFSRLALGTPFQVNSVVRDYRILRLTIGGSFVMHDLTMQILEFGGFAPITILIYQQGPTVHLVYDRLASVLEGCPDKALRSVATIIDGKAEHLLSRAAKGLSL